VARLTSLRGVDDDRRGQPSVEQDSMHQAAVAFVYGAEPNGVPQSHKQTS